MPVPFYLDRARSEENTSANFLKNNRVFNNDAAAQIVQARQAREASINNFFTQRISAIQSARTVSNQRPSSWKDSIDYTKGYDSKIEDKFRSEHDYMGLADYLSNFRMDNVMDQRTYENEISQLRRYGRQYNAVHGNATDEQSESIAFLESFDNGNIDELDDNNSYKKSYNEAIAKLGRKGGYFFADYQAEDYRADDPNSKDAATISVSFNTKKTNYAWFLGLDFLAKDDEKERQFDKFAKETGYSAGEIRNILGENAISIKEGRVIIDVPKTNLEGIRFLTKVRDWCNETNRNATDVSYASYDTDGNIISDDTQYIGSRIQDLSDILKKTETDKQTVMTSIGGDEQIMSTTNLPYMNERQMQLMQMRNAGMLEDSKYSAMLKADNEVYENLLLGTAFSQLDLYTDKGNEMEDETLYQLTDNAEKGKLKHYIRNAIRENRVSWRAGISGGKYGTYLVVTPEDEKGDIITDDDDARSGATIFIPGLFTNSIQNAFNASTQGKAVAEINSMQQYGYEYTLQNGNILSNIGNNMARLYDKNTDSYRDISREEAHDLLHESIIVEDATNNIRNRMFNLDGSVRQGYDYDIDVRKIALATANEIYGGSPLNSDDVWFTSEEARRLKEAEGNIDKDYKRNRALDVYEQLKNNLYKLINTNR